MNAFVHRVVAPLAWRFRGHAVARLAGFARAEQASRIDLLAAAHLTTSPARRARYLRHAADETRHARLFWRHARELAGAPLPAPQADSEDLFARLGEPRFLAFVHRGEHRGRVQFEAYARHFERRGDARTSALFAGIVEDERRHEAYTRDLLVALVGAPQARARELRRAAIWEAWRTWRRVGRALADVVFAVAMMALYVVVAPPVWLVTRRRPTQRWRGDASTVAPTPALEARS